MSYSFIIGPPVSPVDWPFHYHFSHAKNEVSAPRKVSILTSTTAARVLSTFLGVPWPLVHFRFSTSLTISGMSINDNSETSLGSLILIFPLMTPLAQFFLYFRVLPGRHRRTGPYSSGLGRPAHGGSETAPQPFRACADRRLPEVAFSQLLSFPGVHSGISLFFFIPDPAGSQGAAGGTN